MKIYDDEVETENKESYLKITDFDNFFNVYLDKYGNKVYNLNSTLYFLDNLESLPLFTLKHDLQWTLISYQIYGTTRLAWLLMKLNEVKCRDVFKKIKAGESVRYLPEEDVQSIIADINNFDE